MYMIIPNRIFYIYTIKSVSTGTILLDIFGNFLITTFFKNYFCVIKSRFNSFLRRSSLWEIQWLRKSFISLSMNELDLLLKPGWGGGSWILFGHTYGISHFFHFNSLVNIWVLIVSNLNALQYEKIVTHGVVSVRLHRAIHPGCPKIATHPTHRSQARAVIVGCVAVVLLFISVSLSLRRKGPCAGRARR